MADDEGGKAGTQAPRESLVFLVVATEWDSHHGGLSTFNRELCAALAAIGHKVYCGVPKLLDEAFKDASARGVTLVAPAERFNSDAIAALSRPFEGIAHPIDIVIGHSKQTGIHALKQVHHLNGHRAISYVHFIHTDPKEIEWQKDTADPSNAGKAKVLAEQELAKDALLNVAVGPTLAAAYSHYLRKPVHEFVPGIFSELTPVDHIPHGHCLLFGRIEDARLKGLPLAAEAMELICVENDFPYARLNVLGAEPGQEQSLYKELLSKHPGLRVVVEPFCANRDLIVTEIQSSTLVLMPSATEGFGLAGLEAISAGVPVLISNRSGLAVSLKSKVPSLASSHIVNVTNGAPEIAQAIARILRNPRLAVHQVRKLREAMFADFNWRTAAENLVSAIQHAQANGGADTLPHIGYASSEAAAFRAASRSLADWQTTLANTAGWIDRIESAELERFVEQDSNACLVLLGGPGTGKSSLLAGLLRNLQGKGHLVLAIKADQLERTIDSQETLAKQLNLNADVADVLHAEAVLQPTTLIIDQLDALADLVDLKTKRLEVLLELVQKVIQNNDVKVVLSCRQYDFDRDARFQGLRCRTIAISPPSPSAVDAAIEHAGTSVATVPSLVLELVRSNMQALNLFLRIDVEKRSNAGESLLQLSKQVWQQSITGEAATSMEQAAQQIAVFMSEEEQLWIQTAHLRDKGINEAAVTSLVASGLLTFNHDRYEFAHQTLFEYARAKSFGSEQSVAAYVRQRQDALAVRPTLWTVLNYLRDMYPKRYLSGLEILWNDNKTRKHVQGLLIDFLGQVQQPLPRESALLQARLGEPSWRAHIAKAIKGNSAWFESIRQTQLPGIMTSDGAGQMIVVLSAALSLDGDAPDQVIELMTRYWLPNEQHREFILRVLYSYSRWPASAVPLVSRLLACTAPSDPLLQNTLIVAADAVPEFAPQLLVELYCRKLAASSAVDEIAIDQALAADGEIEQLASQKAPAAFARALLPWFAEALNRTASTLLEFQFRPHMCRSASLSRNSLAANLRVALERWASLAPTEVAEFAALQMVSTSIAVHRLIAIALQASLPASKQICLTYLMESDRHLNVGDDTRSELYTTNLVRVLAPMLSEAERAGLRATFIVSKSHGMLPGNEPEAAEFWQKLNEAHQRRLISALDGRDIAQLDQIPEQHRSDVPTRFEGMSSRYKVDDFLAMSDEEILQAFRDMPDGVGLEHPLNPGYGGSWMAAPVLGQAAQRDPERFLGLISRFPSQTNQRPVEAVVQALASEIPVARLEQIIGSLLTRGFFTSLQSRSDLAQLFERHRAEQPLSRKTLALVESWITSTSTDEIAEVDSPLSPTSSILFDELFVRSMPLYGNYYLLCALTKDCFRQSPPDMQRWIDILERHLGRNDSAATWQKFGIRIVDIPTCTKEMGLPFLNSLFTKYPAVLGSQWGALTVERSLRVYSAAQCLQWIDAIENGAWTYGRQAAGELLFLFHARNPADIAVSERIKAAIAAHVAGDATPTFVHGLAYAAAASWTDQTTRLLATDVLASLLLTTDPSLAKVCMRAMSADAMIDDEATKRLLAVLKANSGSVNSARDNDLGEFFDGLASLLPNHAETICSILRGHLAALKQRPASGISLRFGSKMVLIAMTLQRLGPPIRESGLDLFEDMLDLGLWEAQESLASSDAFKPRNSHYQPARRQQQPRPPRR